MSSSIFKTLLIAGVAALTISCGGNSSSGSSDKKFAGSYIDEFGNQFELREDHTATILFKGGDKANETHWSDGPNHDSPFATIEYNGDPSYYYMRDGVLYRHKEDMDRGRPAIKLERQ
ncbi:MAG: hypothetical protein IJV11_02905 [Muribaculaceae bacterium]|nr:hypothetical protein [Muribaculaceae bacterium]